MKIIYQRLKELIAERLRQEIFEGAYKPGTHLVEQNLADQLGVSRGPIREALAQLEIDGLVRVNPRRGAVVTEISPQEASEIYGLRGHLEGLAVRSAAANWTEQESDRLAALVTDMESLGEQDWFRAMALDQQFHALIVEASGNRTLIQTYHTFDPKVVACFLAVKRYLGTLPVAMAERHRRLADALIGGDFVRAESLAVSHWMETGARFRSLAPGHTQSR